MLQETPEKRLTCTKAVNRIQGWDGKRMRCGKRATKLVHPVGAPAWPSCEFHTRGCDHVTSLKEPAHAP